MRQRKLNQDKADEAFGLAELGVIDEQELDRRLDKAGVTTVDVPIEDAPDEILVAAFNGRRASEGYKAYIASLIVGRGLTCGCEACHRIEDYAKRWHAHVAKNHKEE